MQLLFHATIATIQRRSVVAPLRSLRETVLQRITTVQECDARNDESSNAADNKKQSKFHYIINNTITPLSLTITKNQMQILINDTYEELSKQAAADVISLMQASTNKLLCIASGDTPAGLYKEIVTKVNNGELNIDDWHFVGLDEWAGMNGSDEGSCRYHLDTQFFGPLKIK
ncbi:MAG TPA: hypothetical protein VEV15_06565, partial [Flavisolibacter sp.]|nr:hypothetical protein [Flavisolibacter sp.]